MKDRRLWVVLGILLAGGAVFWWSGSRALGRRSDFDKQQEARFAAARRAAAPLDMVPPAESEVLISGLAPLLADPALSTVPATLRTRLSEDASVFLRSRYGQSPDEYIRWRRESGYREVPLAELRSRWFLDQTYQYAFGKPLPGDTDWGDLHAALIEGLEAADGGRHHLVGLAQSSDAMAVSIKRLTPADPGWPALGGLVGNLLDNGSGPATSVSWWSPPRSQRDLLERQGEAWVANVGFVGQFGDGARRPVSISMLWDPPAGRWRIIAMHFGSDKRNEKEFPRVEF